MLLRDFFSVDTVKLDLDAETKDDALRELAALFGLDEKSEGILYKMLKRRENLGSTGIGRGIAIPHCRSLVVNRLRAVRQGCGHPGCAGRTRKAPGLHGAARSARRMTAGVPAGRRM